MGDRAGAHLIATRRRPVVIHIYTIRDGKVLEDSIMTDALAIARQLGLVPGATKAGE